MLAAQIDNALPAHRQTQDALRGKSVPGLPTVACVAAVMPCALPGPFASTRWDATQLLKVNVERLAVGADAGVAETVVCFQLYLAESVSP